MQQNELIAAPPGRVLRLAADRHRWCVDGERALADVDPLEAALLPRLALFETADAHAQALSRILSAPTEAVAAALRRLWNRGLLWSLDDALGVDGAARSALPKEPLIAIRTRGRPAALAALLGSLLDDERRFGVERRYLVIDDAPSLARDPAVVDAVGRFARSSASEVRLLDASHRDRLLGGLPPRVRELLDSDLIDRPSGARAWNLALLCGAGGAVALLDDDFRFPLRAARWAEAVLDPATDAAYATRWLDGRAPEELGLESMTDEPFGWLGSLLGASAGLLAERWGVDRAAARRRTVAMVPGRFGPRRVGAVGVGVHGALNEDTIVHVLAGDPVSRAALLAAPFDPRRLACDSIWRGVLAPRLMAVGVFTPLMIDATTMRPPTIPHGKADDSLFLALMPALDPGVGYLALPASIGHVDAAPRDRIAWTLAPGHEDPLAWLASSIAHAVPSLPTADGAGRRKVLVAMLAALAGADDGELALRVCEWRDRRLPALIARLREARADAGSDAPRELSALLDAVIAAHERWLFGREVAADFIATLRDACAALAGAIEVWPQLWDEAGPHWLERVPVLGGRAGADP